MEKVFMYRGVRYGPGFKTPTEELKEKFGLSPRTTRASSKTKTAKTAQDEALPANFPMAAILIEEGFTNMVEVAEATDEELLELPGIGEGRLREIREFLAENHVG